jgi:hypothetical protein
VIIELVGRTPWSAADAHVGLLAITGPGGPPRRAAQPQLKLGRRGRRPRTRRSAPRIVASRKETDR